MAPSTGCQAALARGAVRSIESMAADGILGFEEPGEIESWAKLLGKIEEPGLSSREIEIDGILGFEDRNSKLLGKIVKSRAKLLGRSRNREPGPSSREMEREDRS
jgi:hypothetical protein